MKPRYARLELAGIRCLATQPAGRCLSANLISRCSILICFKRSYIAECKKPATSAGFFMFW